MRGLLGPICFPADSNYPVGNFTISPSHPPPSRDGPLSALQTSAGSFFCVPTAAKCARLLMRFDTNGAVRQCDYAPPPHAAQTWQEMTPDSAPFHPYPPAPTNSVETIFGSQLEPTRPPFSPQFPLPSIILQVAENKILWPDAWWVG